MNQTQLPHYDRLSQAYNQINLLKWNLNQRVLAIEAQTRDIDTLKTENEHFRNFISNLKSIHEAKLENLTKLYEDKLHEERLKHESECFNKDREIIRLKYKLDELIEQQTNNDACHTNTHRILPTPPPEEEKEDERKRNKRVKVVEEANRVKRRRLN